MLHVYFVNYQKVNSQQTISPDSLNAVQHRTTTVVQYITTCVEFEKITVVYLLDVLCTMPWQRGFCTALFLINQLYLYIIYYIIHSHFHIVRGNITNDYMHLLIKGEGGGGGMHVHVLDCKLVQLSFSLSLLCLRILYVPLLHYRQLSTSGVTLGTFY